MIDHLLQPLVCERFLTDARYREGHLRVVNALPERRVMGLHSPDIKRVAMARVAVETIVGSSAKPTKLSQAVPPSIPAVMAVLENRIIPKKEKLRQKLLKKIWRLIKS